MKRIILYILIFALLPVFGLWAQTAAEMETLLGTPAVTYAQAARFVLEASDAAKIANPEEALAFAVEREWLPNVRPDTPATLESLSLLFMRSFDIKGGILYSLVKSPHYAYRELMYQNVIQGRVDPHMAVSGYDLLFFTNRILAMRESQQ